MTDIKQHNNVSFVKLPEGAEEIQLSLLCHNLLYYIESKDSWSYKYGIRVKCEIKLPSGNWQLLGGALELKEEDKKKILDYRDIEDWHEDLGFFYVRFYKNYITNNFEFENWQDSYTSLLTHLEINNDWIVLIK